MGYMRFILVLLVFVSGTASADVWKWVDANGKTHFVDTDKSIYTWRDESGRVFYSDKKDHDDAVLVQLVWHSSGSLEEMESQEDEYRPGETPEERAERLDAEAYYCKQATEIYESYMNAPRLYRTADDGSKEYVSDAEAKAIIDETRAKKDELCN